MSDIIERLKEPEAHYPGNFDTPKRANAMLSCLCQEAMEEIKSLRQQLAEKDAEIDRLNAALVIAENNKWILDRKLVINQLRNRQLREAMEQEINYHSMQAGPKICLISNKLSPLPQDTTALEALIAKAGEVMRGRCSGSAQAEMDEQYIDSPPWYAVEACRDAISALPGVTLGDLK